MLTTQVLRLYLAVAFVFACLFHQAMADNNWTQFRGPGSRGVVSQNAKALPVRWSATENIAWKVDVEGRGWSSPIVWGDRIFLTSVVNQGETEAAKKGLYFGGNRPKPPETIHQWWVLCLDLTTGETIWKKNVREGKPQTGVHVKNSFASETPVTDGKHVYALFGGVGVFCFDFDGTEIWKKEIKPRKTRFGWGTAASPVLDGERLFIVDDNDEDSYLMALDKNTGDEIWRVEREDEDSNWATPYIWQNGDQKQIVTPGTDKVRAYDMDGKLVWWFTGMSSITIATPYESEGLLIISSGYVGDKSRPLYAIRAGAVGDITLKDDATSNAFIAWSHPQSAPYNPSTISYEGIVYVLHDRGLFAAYDANDGSEIYAKKRIPEGRAFTSSPWAYDGKIFCLNEDGKTFVIKAGKEFVVLHTNELQDDDMGMATPALAGDRLLLRTDTRLYCVKN